MQLACVRLGFGVYGINTRDKDDITLFKGACAGINREGCAGLRCTINQVVTRAVVCAGRMNRPHSVFVHVFEAKELTRDHALTICLRNLGSIVKLASNSLNKFKVILRVHVQHARGWRQAICQLLVAGQNVAGCDSRTNIRNFLIHVHIHRHGIRFDISRQHRHSRVKNALREVIKRKG